jgi:hypothetical protein
MPKAHQSKEFACCTEHTNVTLTLHIERIHLIALQKSTYSAYIRILYVFSLIFSESGVLQINHLPSC